MVQAHCHVLYFYLPGILVIMKRHGWTSHIKIRPRTKQFIFDAQKSEEVDLLEFFA